MGQALAVRGLTGLALLAALALAGCGPSPAQKAAAIAWAYPISPPAPNPAPPVDKVTPQHVAGSEITFTTPALKDLFAAPDWFPQGHPAMPPVVAVGRRPDVMACGFCHLPTGDGRPENAALSGLPRQYIVDQMRAFRSGARHASVIERLPSALMVKIGKAATDEEIAAAADYFSALPRHSFTRVVETDEVPLTLTKGWLYSRDPKGGSEAIGGRVIEMPDDFERFEHRDPATAYVAYVPRGSIAKGEELAKTWGGGKQACAKCHGPDLKGKDNVPALAGRAPTYIVRQLNDIRTGARNGPTTEVMKAVVSPMADADIISLAAFLGSREP